eukprot:CAMPEP_0196132962 /NCGR_PEP_ID=MMETSP0910-20130528/2376_1 /TAXON_ID=49265 /ORGANISM="Thalassiosira rotula, Strain GSO102" /LENGTH=85 /DNA_ID=CAMNT_0041392627 /DNA_START=756 /DNA_END=1013 /DNA_ORIENTATION=+
MTFVLDRCLVQLMEPGKCKLCNGKWPLHGNEGLAIGGASINLKKSIIVEYEMIDCLVLEVTGGIDGEYLLASTFYNIDVMRGYFR